MASIQPVSLFPSGSPGGAGAGGKKPLVQFRAGRMNLEETWVRPDARKGLVTLDVLEDGLVHFMWKDRSNNATEEDLIIFPQDAVYKHVSQCTTGRVYMLHFASSSRKLFFWMQEPKTDKDDEYCTKINEYMNNPPQPGQQTPAGGASNSSNILAQLMGLTGGSGGAFGRGRSMGMMLRRPGAPGVTGDTTSTTAPVAPSATTSTQQSQPQPQPPSDALSSAADAVALAANATSPATAITSTSSVSGVSSTPSLGGAAAAIPHQAGASLLQPINTGATFDSLLQSMLANLQVPAQRPPLHDADLSRILTPENIAPLLQDQAIQQRIFPFLPERAERSREELDDIVRSPQFRQSGQQGPLIAQLGLDPAVGGPLGGVEAFLEAIRQQTRLGQGNQQQQQQPQQPPSSEGHDDQDNMDVN